MGTIELLFLAFCSVYFVIAFEIPKSVRNLFATLVGRKPDREDE